ncbi:MAG: type II secretion system protein [Chitinispirillaceae bacterium]|nr:type II secretion system protein [Chitinispirillaceae bacterium]
MKTAEQKGMTLVEVLVASIISVIIALAIYSVYSMYVTQTRETNASLAMQMQYENLSEQIAMDTRVARKLLRLTDALHDTCDTLPDQVTGFYYYPVDGTTPFAGMRIQGDRLQEFRDDGWKDFNTGNNTVFVDPDSSYFILNGCRKGIQVHLRLAFPGPETYYLDPREDVFLCRNN